MTTFEHEMRKAQTMGKLERPDYWAGVQRGLRRGYFANFGTHAEHELWMSLIDDPCRQDHGQGYRDGLALMATI